MLNIVSQLLKIHFEAMIASMFSFMSGKRSVNRPNKSISGIVITILLIFLMLVMLTFFFSAGVILSAMTFWYKVPEFYFAIIFTASIIFSIMGSIFASQSYLFDAEDNELLMSMPLKPSVILTSRIATLYFLNLFYGSIITFPTLVAYSIVIGFSLKAFILYLVSMFLTPIFVTAMCCFIGYILWLINSKFAKKNVGSMIFALLFFSGLIFVSLKLGSANDISFVDHKALQQFFYSASNSLYSYFPPAYWYGTAIQNCDIIYMLMYVALCIVPMLIMFGFLSLKLKKIMTTKRSEKKKHYVAKPLKQSSVMSALIKKELKTFFSISGYLMNSGMGTLASIVMGIIFLFKGSSIPQFVSENISNASGLIPLSFACGLVVTAVMNDVTAPSISLEAKTLWILKSSPINPMDIVISKSLISPIITIPGITIATICYVIGMFPNVTIADVLFIFLMPILATTFSGFLGVLINLRFPRFDWSSQIIVIKQSGSVLLSLLSSVFISAFPFILAICLPILISDYNILISYAMCFLFMLLALIITIIILKKNCNRLYNKL